MYPEGMRKRGVYETQKNRCGMIWFYYTNMDGWFPDNFLNSSSWTLKHEYFFISSSSIYGMYVLNCILNEHLKNSRIISNSRKKTHSDSDWCQLMEKENLAIA